MKKDLMIHHPLYSYPDAAPSENEQLGWAEGHLSGGCPYRLEKYIQAKKVMLAIYACDSGMMFEQVHRMVNMFEKAGLVTCFGKCEPSFTLLEDTNGDELEMLRITLEDKEKKLAHCEIRLHDDSGNPIPDPNETLLAKAIAFAAEKHRGQVRKGTNIPYIVHPMEAAAITATMTSDPELIAAAVLHDTLEDCEGVTEDLLRALFGKRVAQLVCAESEEKQADAAGSWKTRKQVTIDHLQKPECSQAVKILTLSDKLSNLRALHRDQLAIGEKLWKRFNQKDKEMHRWYYASIGSALSCLKECPAWKEYNTLLGEVFDGAKGQGVPVSLTVQQVPVYKKEYHKGGKRNLKYEGYVLPDGSYWGAGRTFYIDGTVSSEGIYTKGGLLAGKMYYPSGKLKFNGTCNDKRSPECGNYYGPTYPIKGQFYAEDDTLLYDGDFKIEHTGSAGWPKVIYPEGFGSLDIY